MFIHEAVKETVENKKYIAIEKMKAVKISPTNERELCIVIQADGSNKSKYGWKPSADDLMRDDWTVVD